MYASGVDAGSSGLEYPAHGEWPDVRRRVAPPSHDLVIEIATRLAYRVPGNIIEFGVFEGRSTRVLRRALHQLQRGQLLGPRKEIFACDSFKGLPEKYENLGVGAFACAPPSIPGVHIVEGYFEDSLTPELARRVGRVALASSTPTSTPRRSARSGGSRRCSTRGVSCCSTNTWEEAPGNAVRTRTGFARPDFVPCALPSSSESRAGRAVTAIMVPHPIGASCSKSSVPLNS